MLLMCRCACSSDSIPATTCCCTPADSICICMLSCCCCCSRSCCCCLRTYTHACTFMHTCTPKHMKTCINTYARIYADTHTHTHMHATHMHTYMHACIHACIHANTHPSGTFLCMHVFFCKCSAECENDDDLCLRVVSVRVWGRGYLLFLLLHRVFMSVTAHSWPTLPRPLLSLPGLPTGISSLFS